MRRLIASLTTSIALLATVSSAHAAVSYNDPWVEGDLEQMRVPEALDVLARTPDRVTVAVVDSGARLRDPDLAPHLLKMSGPYTCQSAYGPGPDYAADPADGDVGCDFIGTGSESAVTTSPDGDPTDPFGHGTGAAAVIAGVPNDGIEGAGVAPNARVLPVRACYGGNPDCFNEPAVLGLDYAIAMGARIVSASWPPGNDYGSDLRQVIHTHPDVLFVFAIGGTGQDQRPYTLCTNDAQFPNVVCVGLVNPDDSAGTTQASTTTDVSAPGEAGVPAADGSRSEFGSTSGATAHVAGAAAILRGLAPTLSAQAIRDVLVSTSRAHAGYETANMAHGIVDVEAAVREVQRRAGFVTPASGAGAPADTPNPFPPSASAGGGTTGTSGATGTSGPAGTGGAGGAGGTSGGTTGTAGPAGPAGPAAVSPTVKLLKAPKAVRAGRTLRLEVRVTNGPVTVEVSLRRGRRTLASATKRKATGTLRLSLRVPKRTKPGAATLRLDDAVTRPHDQRIRVLRR